ncbi:MAG: galactokinase [Oscillospiraceae bacterium]|jgi:galactokinase|nr:galactokinase [Oscillospiraceae bacterium]
MKQLCHDLAAWEAYLTSQAGLTALTLLYGDGARDQAARYLAAARRYVERFGNHPFAFLSAPGRTELSGNHTDHQRGRVLAAAVALDILAVAAPAEDGRVRMFDSYGDIDINVDDTALHPEEVNRTEALIRGVAVGMRNHGYRAGGFDAHLTSDVPKGSGLSSSAAIEVLFGTLMNHFYNAGRIGAPRVAQIGQYAENVYFGKPCGLMDQMSSSVGGIVSIDFKDTEEPLVRRLACDGFPPAYTLCIVDTRGDHADLTQEYADIPGEMRAVAAYFDKEVLRDVSQEAFYAALPVLREQAPQRGVLRAIHFFGENERVVHQAKALEDGDMETYRTLMLASGDSSFKLLQNIFPVTHTGERSVALGLALSERMLADTGAWRVHGGGFAGTIQALVPRVQAAAFTAEMTRVFGGGCCYPLMVRPVGGYCLPGPAF